jgi:ADP-heptose:LPS heptosyltransferase
VAVRSRLLGRVLDVGLGWVLYRGKPVPAEPFDPDRVQRILIVRNDNLGDLLCTTPTFRALRRRYPLAHIAVLVPAHCRPLLRDNPDVDEVISYIKAKHRTRGTTLGAWWEMLRMFRALWARRFDLAIGMRQRFSQPAAWLVYASRAPWRLGNRPPPQEPFGFFLNLGSPQPEGLEIQHEVDSALRILRPLGVPPVPRDLILTVQSDAWERVDTRLAKLGIGPEERVALVHISNRRPTSRWPAERFAAVADCLAERHGFRVLVNWAPGDLTNPLFPGDDNRAGDVLCRVRPSIIPWETPTLEELVASIRRSQFVFSTDGGVMHMAAAFHVPQVVIFGRTPLELWRPCSVVARVLKRGHESVNTGVEEALAAVQALSAELRWPTAGQAAVSPATAGAGRDETNRGEP